MVTISLFSIPGGDFRNTLDNHTDPPDGCGEEQGVNLLPVPALGIEQERCFGVKRGKSVEKDEKFAVLPVDPRTESIGNDIRV
jgi:hypothetical protein